MLSAQGNCGRVAPSSCCACQCASHGHGDLTLSHGGNGQQSCNPQHSGAPRFRGALVREMSLLPLRPSTATPRATMPATTPTASVGTLRPVSSCLLPFTYRRGCSNAACLKFGQPPGLVNAAFTRTGCAGTQGDREAAQGRPGQCERSGFTGCIGTCPTKEHGAIAKWCCAWRMLRSAHLYCKDVGLTSGIVISVAKGLHHALLQNAGIIQRNSTVACA